MAVYEITAPDGRRFELTGPPDATPEQIRAKAQQLIAPSGRDPRTGQADPDLATVDALMAGTAEGAPVEPTLADQLRSVRKETSLPLVAATMGSIAAGPVGGAAARAGMLARTAAPVAGAAAGGGAAGGALEAEDPAATAESIAMAAIESGGEMAMAELAGLGLGAATSRLIAPDLKYLDPLKGVREDISRYTGEVMQGKTMRELAETWRNMSAAQRAKIPAETREALERFSGVTDSLKKVGRFMRTPVGGEVAEALAVPVVAALFGPGVALSLSIGKALLDPGPVTRYLTRNKLPSEPVRAAASQATRTGARAAVSEEE